MNAIVVEEYGDIPKLIARKVPKPGDPKDHDILVKVKGASVNPVDIKVRGGVYDDYPDYYDRVPRPYQIIGFDGSGIVEQVGSAVEAFKPGDEVYYSGSPVRHGSNADYQLVDSRSVAKKPQTLDFVEAASMPLTYITAYEALVERMEIKKGEKASLLIINGSGGVGAVASQIARVVLGLPVVVTTASRPETQSFSQKMGATHVINHREELGPQISDLNLPYPLKYIFITHSTDQYLSTCTSLIAPFGKICSIVQGKVQMYGTEAMAKSISFIWELLGTKPYYGVQLDSHGKILEELRQLIEAGKIKCHLTKRLRLDLKGLRKGHELIEGGGSMGKNGLGVDVEGEEGEGGSGLPFT